MQTWCSISGYEKMNNLPSMVLVVAIKLVVDVYWSFHTPGNLYTRFLEHVNYVIFARLEVKQSNCKNKLHIVYQKR